MSGTVSSEEVTYAWLGPVIKTEKADDGSVYVYGKATDGSVDSDEQIVDPEFAKKALADWYATGANVRQMHSTNLPPAGKGVTLESTSDGEFVKTHVVEPVAVKLVNADVYMGYSVGISHPRIVRDNKARGGRIVGGKIVELSLVDRPALPTAKFAVLKMEGSALEFIGKVVILDAEPEVSERAPKPLRRYQKGAHVTVHARSPYGDVVAYEGRVKDRGLGNLAIDQAGYDTGGVLHFSAEDIVGVYKGSVTLSSVLEKRKKSPDKAASPDVAKGDQVVTHTEELMAEAKTDSGAKTAKKAADAAAADCDKCGGVGKVDGADCDKCGGSGKVEIVKDASVAKNGGDVHVTVGPAEEEDKAAFPGAAKPFTSASDGPAADDKAATPAVAKSKKPKAPKGNKFPPAAETPAEDGAEEPAPGEKVQKVRKVRKGLRVEPAGEQWVVMKGSKVLGTHPIQGAALAHKNAILKERKAAKAAKATARKSAKAAKAARKAARAIVTKSVTVAGEDELPWLLRRAHDFTCGAYKTEDIYDVYPSSEDGAALTKSVRAALYTELAAEVGKSAGANGKNVSNIEGLGKALRALTDIIEVSKSPDINEALTAARGELHEVFKAANGFEDAKPDGIPKPAESITPGEFQRGYLSSGRAQEHASSHDANIPTTTHPVSPSDFKRGPLTEGHQRYLAHKMEEFHDGLTEWRPELCRMDANGSHAFDRQPAGSFARGPLLAQVPNGQGNGPTPVNPGKPKSAPGEKVEHFELNPVEAPVVKQLTAEDIREAVTKALKPQLKKIAALESTVDAMASAPDPNRSASRGVAGQGKRMKAEKVATADKAQRKAARGEKADRIAYYQSMANSTDPETRTHAADWLARKGLEVD